MEKISAPAETKISEGKRPLAVKVSRKPKVRLLCCTWLIPCRLKPAEIRPFLLAKDIDGKDLPVTSFKQYNVEFPRAHLKAKCKRTARLQRT